MWLREQGCEAWLAHLLFVDDQISPTSEPEWEAAMERVHEEMGLAAVSDLPAFHVFLPALSRDGLD